MSLPAHSTHPRASHLARTNSSFFGSLKSLVTAPLAWFGNEADFQDEKDLSGKRRRNAAAAEPQPASLDTISEESEPGPAPAKRMRINSPDRFATAYLDPPVAAFKAHSISPTKPSVSRFSTHATANFSTENSRNLTGRGLSPTTRHLSRTMSVDKQFPSARRDTSMPSSFQDTDVSMEPISNAASYFNPSVTRDHSMPPLSSGARPAFKIRTSMTPQPPQLRDRSEPPSISSLRSNPVFVRPPSQGPSSPRKLSAPSVMTPPTTSTLGNLYESQRSTRSPSRHGSLLFGSPATQPSPGVFSPLSTNVPISTSSPVSNRFMSPTEKLIHDLDIYKTPIVPSKLRSMTPSESLINSTSAAGGDSLDLFRKRKKLVLMSDDSDRTSSKKSKKSPTTNKTKPYAGEGGMKKLLAKRKLEAEQAREEVVRRLKEQQQQSPTKISKEIQTAPLESLPVPKVADEEWFKLASEGTAPLPNGGSSLRVGRTPINRNHIVRPSSRPKRGGFSAIDEDEADGEGDIRSMEEKKPSSSPLPAFSFAKDTTSASPTPPPTIEAKEPPVASLPFSFGVPPTAPSSSSLFGAPSIPSTDAEPLANSSVSAPPAAAATSPPPAPSSGTGSIPNFFASSLKSSAPVSLPTPPASALFLAPPAAAPVSSEPAVAAPLPSAPAPTITNSVLGLSTHPFSQPSLGDANASVTSLFSGAGDTAKPKPFGFGSVEKEKENIGTPVADVTVNQAIPQSSVGSLFGTSLPVRAEETPIKPAGFSFAPTRPEGNITKAPGFSFAKDPLVNPFAPAEKGLEDATSTTTQPETKLAPSFSFAPSDNTPASGRLFGGTSSAAPSSSGGTTGFSFGNLSSKGTGDAPASKPLFGGGEDKKSFGGSSTTLSEPPKSDFLPKSSFDGTSGFTFGQPSSSGDVTKGESTLARSTSSTGFTFGKPAAPSMTSTPSFSFSDSASSSTNKPFAFGSAASTRAVTPPRTESQEQEFRMDESPTRDPPPKPQPSFGGGFNFVSSTSSSTSNPFASSTPASNPFGSAMSATSKPEESKPFGSLGGSGFGQSTQQASTPFTFNAKPADNTPPRPSTAGSFFSSSTSGSGAAPPTTSPFSFGNNNNTSNGNNPFGQSGSAPSSPAAFGAQPLTPTFSFGQPSNNQGSNLFQFGGSQPASPAIASPSLPAPVMGGGNGSSPFVFGGAPASQPSTPFGAPPLAAQPSTPFGASAPTVTTPGGTLFTIGAAPTANPMPPGARPTKKLPTRRTTGKR